jgi:hypothetical protein
MVGAVEREAGRAVNTAQERVLTRTPPDTCQPTPLLHGRLVCYAQGFFPGEQNVTSG